MFRRDGAGYLRSKVQNWCEFARHQPLLLITDLDRKACASVVIAEWFERHKPPKNLVFRIAVREIESWLLADHEAMVTLLGRGCAARLPNDPDTLPDPKARLLELARRAPRDVRDDLMAPMGSTARQGVGYNARLCAFVDTAWCPDRAARRSSSLHRANVRLQELADRTTK